MNQRPISPHSHGYLPRRHLAARLGLGLIFGMAGASAWAQAWPAQTITLVIPFAAGSGTDAVARVVAQKLSERLGQQVLVEPRPGASAQLAAQHVARAKPDGYTLFMSTNTAHSANPSLFKELKYEPIKDFTPILRVGELPFAIALGNHVPAKTLPELIAYAKANPGKLSFGHASSTSLVAAETIKRMAGIQMVGIPYKASPQVMTDLIGGSLDFYAVDMGSGMGALTSGKIRPVAVTTAKPIATLPGVPPVAQVLPGFDITSWNGILGPAGLPRAIVERVNSEMQTILAQKDVRDRLTQMGFEVDPTATPEDFAKYLQYQLTNWTQLIREAGIKPE